MSIGPAIAEPPTPAPALCAQGVAWRWTGHCTLSTVRDVSRQVRAFLAAHGVTSREQDEWELIFSEAGNNAVLHTGGGAGNWEVDVFVSTGFVRVTFTDFTGGFEWPEVVELPDEDAESGRGLWLITTLTDHQDYVRGRDRNLLTLTRNRPAAPTARAAAPASEDPEARIAGLEETLDSMTEELGAAYESLSAIFQFSAELNRSEDASAFAGRLLSHLATITQATGGIIRVPAESGTGLTTVATCGTPAEVDLFRPLEEQAIRCRQDQWIDQSTFAGRPGTTPQSGLVHPFYDGDELMGVITLGRHGIPEPLRAGEVNVVHTFAEFFSQQVIRRRHEEAAVRASMARRELELAATIQRSLLPRAMPRIRGMEVMGHCESAMQVGGDFYDVVPWESRGLFFVMADVMGKGVGASMMAAVTRMVFRSMPQVYQTPGKVMERAAKLLYDDLDHLEIFVTAAVGLVDVPRGVIRIANAGHCPLLCVNPDGKVTQYEDGGLPLGLERSPVYEEYEIPFLPGTSLAVFTDGLTDPRDNRGAFETPEEFGAWLAETCPTLDGTLPGLHNALLSRLRNRDAGGSLADDQTFLLLGRTDESLTS